MVILSENLFFQVFRFYKIVTMSAESNQADLFARVDFPLYSISMVGIQKEARQNIEIFL